MSTEQQSEWQTIYDAWDAFVKRHPELGYRAGRWQLINFLRLHRDVLTRCDAIRKARARQWIAHSQRFPTAAFDCATGVSRPNVEGGAS